MIDLDSPLIGSAQGQITMCACTDFDEPDVEDDAYEAWACYPLDHVWFITTTSAIGEPRGDLRNPPG